MNILSMMIIALVGVVTAVIIKGYKAEFGFMIILIISFFFLGWLMTVVQELKIKLNDLERFFSENQFYYEILFKITSITYLCEFTSGICKDAGYSSVASQIEMSGKIMVLLSAAPVISALIEVFEQYHI